jgi:DNA-binding transcriptional regulator YiaG
MTRRWSRIAGLAARPRAAGGVPLGPAEIRELRGARTRRDFARHLGVSVTTVYLWEAGRMRPSGPNLARLRGAVARVLQRRPKTRRPLS